MNGLYLVITLLFPVAMVFIDIFWFAKPLGKSVKTEMANFFWLIILYGFILAVSLSVFSIYDKSRALLIPSAFFILLTYTAFYFIITLSLRWKSKQKNELKELLQA